ncbi:MAG TPA: delta-60 repeat domain-containing protein [Solirubrobacteraceae bacterium]
MTFPRTLLAVALAALAAPAAAHAAAGDLDQRFGTGGTLLVPVEGGDAAGSGVAVAPSGELVVAGDVTAAEPDEPGARRLVLARFGPFGDPLSLFRFPPQDPPADTGAAAVSVGPAGQILAAGSWLVPTEGRAAGLVTRHAADGELYPPFGGRGWATPGFDGGAAEDVAALPDGGALVAGRRLEGNGSRGELVRVGADGAAVAAEPTAEPGREERYEAVAAMPGGAAVVAGTADDAEGVPGFLVARFGADGRVAGVARTPFPQGAAVASDVVALADGSAIAVGSAAPGGDAEWALVRYGPDGTLDPAFGDGGRVVIAASAFEDRLLAAAPGPRDTIVAAGFVGTGEFGLRTMAVARFTADGRRDPSFGANGVVRIAAGEDEAVAAADVAVLPDGDVVTVGTGATRAGRLVVALARLLGDGPAPPLAVGGGGGPGEPPAVAGVPARARFAIRLVSRRVERHGTVRVRVRWPRGWRGAARIRITRVRAPHILVASQPIRGTGGRGRTFRVKLTRLGRDALLGVRRTRVRLALVPDAAALERRRTSVQTLADC